MFDLNSVEDYDPEKIYVSDEKFLDSFKNAKLDFSKGLPNGILDKRYTGIGATTAEFKSDRKSIIIFPFIKIALEKYIKYKDKKDILYVGTDDNNNSISIDDIASFVRKNKDKHLKFCVVADSIKKVIEGIKKAGENPYNDYFLVLDEVEILQMQSSFRTNLPLCFDYFKKFKNKCLVSATLLNITDIDLQKLPVHYVEKLEKNKYGKYVKFKEKIEFKEYETQYPHLRVAQDILEFYKKFPEHKNLKFFIGLNSKKAIRQFIDEIEKSNKSITISLLVSESSKDDFFKRFTKSKIENKKLPCQINISTCIAWSGIDIEDQFFSVAISLNSEIHHSFSFENLIQFFGRCRLNKKSQLSKTLVVGSKPELLFNKPDGSYIERINNIESSIRYINKTIKSKTDKKDIFNALTKTKQNLIYQDINGEPKVNWLLKDLESYTLTVVDDYKDIYNGLLKRLGKRYEIETKITLLKEVHVIEKTSEETLENKLETLIDNLDKEYPDTKLINHIRNTTMPSKRLAAYWFLFGRKVIGSTEDSLRLAKYFSGFDGELPKNGLLSITKIYLDSVYLYQFEPILWQELVKNLQEISRDGKRKIASEFKDIFKDPKYSLFFPSINKSPRFNTSIGSFIKYVLGIQSEGQSGGVNTFLINTNEKYIPKIYREFPNLHQKLSSINKFPKGTGGITFGKVNIQDLLSEVFS